MPKMTHPDSKQTVDVDAGRAALLRGQGWLEVKPKTDSKSK